MEILDFDKPKKVTARTDYSNTLKVSFSSFDCVAVLLLLVFVCISLFFFQLIALSYDRTAHASWYCLVLSVRRVDLN